MWLKNRALLFQLILLQRQKQTKVLFEEARKSRHPGVIEDPRCEVQGSPECGLLLSLHRPSCSSWDRSIGRRDGRGRWGHNPPKPAPPQPRGSLRPQSRSQPQAWEDKCLRNKPRRRQLSAGGTSLPEDGAAGRARLMGKPNQQPAFPSAPRGTPRLRVETGSQEGPWAPPWPERGFLSGGGARSYKTITSEDLR
uniref:Uncharacterized protein n=1 Tax=Rangifer tarandus platyrhynchus TaxID=3082113 RepID=A0ACB0F4G9_RANTA|nr:unnamed protein product [Rangifer tarandus platyrhynchus]